MTTKRTISLYIAVVIPSFLYTKQFTRCPLHSCYHTFTFVYQVVFKVPSTELLPYLHFIVFKVPSTELLLYLHFYQHPSSRAY